MKIINNRHNSTSLEPTQGMMGVSFSAMCRLWTFERNSMAPSLKVRVRKKDMERFEKLIWEDIFSGYFYSYASYPEIDDVLPELIELHSDVFPNGRVSSDTLGPNDDPTDLVFRARYRLNRLQEYKSLRDDYPDLAEYRVQRSKNQDKECFLVQVGTTGYLLKKSSLMECDFFNRMFQHPVTETNAGRCHLKADNGWMFDEDSLCAILEFLCNDRIDFEKHDWLSILQASIYLGSHRAKRKVYSFLPNYDLGLEEALFVYNLFVGQKEMDPSPAMHYSRERIKGNLRVLVAETKPFTHIRSMTRGLMVEILSDTRLTYFSMRDRSILLHKLIAVSPSQEEADDRESLYRFIDPTDITCRDIAMTYRNSAYKSRHEECLGLNVNNANGTRCLIPTIIIAGGTGEGVTHEHFESISRPRIPSNTLMIYNIEDNGWHNLPNMPVRMTSPLVASNDLDCIYVIDAYSFKRGGLVREHYFFSLTFVNERWFWKSHLFEMPVGIRKCILHNILCVDYKLYFVATVTMYPQIFSEWDHGEEHRTRLLASIAAETDPLRRSLNSKLTRVAILLRYNGTTSQIQLVAFLFHLDRPILKVHSCAMDSGVFVAAQRAVPIDSNTNMCPRGIFCVFDCKQGIIINSSHGDVKMGGSHKVVAKQGINSIANVLLGECCHGVKNHGIEDGVPVPITSITIPHPHLPTSIEGDSSLLTNFMVASDRKYVYIIGGCTAQSRHSSCRRIHFRGDNNQEMVSESIAPLPLGAFSSGVTIAYVAKQCFSHHMKCPHCVLYPDEKRIGDTSDVCLPDGYEEEMISINVPMFSF